MQGLHHTLEIAMLLRTSIIQLQELEAMIPKRSLEEVVTDLRNKINEIAASNPPVLKAGEQSIDLLRLSDKDIGLIKQRLCRETARKTLANNPA